MSNLKIQRVLPGDIERWFKVRIESLYDSPSAFLASPETEISQGADYFKKSIENGGDENVIFGCFEGDEIVGSVGLYRESAAKARHKGTIWGVYVKPDYRGQKIGRRLLQAAIEFAQVTMKLEKIDLSVDSSREPAKKIYASLGFKKWGLEKRAVQIDGKYFDEEYMSLDFSEC
jgi:ribosomal protein S18 acetylase RimI-like enzyme